jgi:diguanylate cyclase (GGDEF)-like protein
MNTTEKNPFLFFFTLLILVSLPVIIVLQTYFTYSDQNHSSHQAIKGFIDLSQIDFTHQKTVALDGAWSFYTSKLLNPDTVSLHQPDLWIDLPTNLPDNANPGSFVGGSGYATLALSIKVPPSKEIYGIKFDYMGSANRIWVNGVELASNGVVSTFKEEFIPQYQSQEVFFKNQEEVIEVVVQVANFHHKNITLGTVTFGSLEGLSKNTLSEIILQSLVIGSLLFIAIYYSILYLFQQNKPALIHLALIALLMAIRSSVVDERILIRIFPSFPPEILVKLGYLSALILLPLLLAYVKEVMDSSKLQKIAPFAKWGGFAILITVVISPARVYTSLFEYATLPLVGLGLYILYSVVSEGMMEQKRGAKVLVGGGVLVLFAAIHDIVREFTAMDSPELLSVAMTLFIILQASFLAWTLADAYEKEARLAKENKRMYYQIATLNEGLEQKIRQRTEELEYANQELEKLSQIDPLTNVMNRRYFEQVLQQMWAQAKEKNESLSVLMIDIDFFKGFNDTYGHLEGDHCLQKVAKTLKNYGLAQRGIVARYGGEEFIALLPHMSLEEAYDKAYTIRKDIENLKIPHQSSSIHPYVTVSIGMSRVHFNPHTQNENPYTFIDSADKALYEAKNQGRNRVVYTNSKIE